MTRLNNDMRDDITNAVILHRFLSEAQSLVSSHAALAATVYDDVYGELVEQMNNLPDGWLPESSEITVNSGGEKHILRFDGSAPYRSSWVFREVEAPPVTKRTPAKDNRSCDPTKSYSARSTIATCITELATRLGSFNDRTATAQRETRAMLDKFHTVEKLIEGWPEIEPFIPVKQKPVTLPAVPTKHLNEMLGLPVGDA